MTVYSTRRLVPCPFVTTGHSRSKNGVASLAYDPVVHDAVRLSKCIGKHLSAPLLRMDCRVKPGNDE